MTRARSDRLFTTSPFVLLASFGLFWFADTIADPDLWGHIRFGQDIVRTGSIIQIDSYSYQTDGQPWMNHEWLSEVIFGSLYNQAGPTGLIAFKVLVSLLIIGLCNAHLRRNGLGPFPTMLLLLLISITFRMGLGTIRPQLFTYLFFLVQLLVLTKGSMEREHWLWVLPILFRGWVNLHGGVLAGIGVLGMWIAVRIVVRLKVDASPRIGRLGAVAQLSLIATACGLAVLLNPAQVVTLRPELLDRGAQPACLAYLDRSLTRTVRLHPHRTILFRVPRARSNTSSEAGSAATWRSLSIGENTFSGI
jgi:hypothetical protein